MSKHYKSNAQQCFIAMIDNQLFLYKAVQPFSLLWITHIYYTILIFNVM